jgi:GTP cyclohydrolase I
MKQKETLWSSRPVNGMTVDEIGDEHIGTSAETPLREDAFDLDDELKIELIQKHFEEIMQILGSRSVVMTACVVLPKEWPKCM